MPPSGILLALTGVMREDRGRSLMGARPDCLSMHMWYWMQTWRVASSPGEAKGTKRPERRRSMPPRSEDVVAAAWLRLPPGVLFAGRLGLDLGIAADLRLGGRRHF